MMRGKLCYSKVLLLLIVFSFTGCNKTKETMDTTVATQPSNTEVAGIGEENANLGTVDTQNEIQLQRNEIAFSKMEYFNDQSIVVEVLSKEQGEIYYTIDGTDPTKASTLYKEPIHLEADNSVNATCLKAKAFFEDGSESNIIVHTYFVGEDAKERFNTLVFSVTTDPYNLFDYEYGIFVEGKLRADYIKENPGEKVNPDAPANFNMRGRESERKVFLEIIEPNNEKILAQTVGIRTYGGWSRAREQKSIKIFARKEYDEVNNKLRYDFFPEKTSADGKGNLLDSFKQLVLRNCGNDNGFGFIRDELFQTLAGQAGYLDYEAVRPASLYINGDYRGFFWLHEVYGDEYFEDHYGKYKGNFEVLEGGEDYKNIDTDGNNREAVEEYITFYHKYADMDLTEDTNYQKVCDLLDVKNYLEYYAIQTYIANEDWPHNNYKTYRYYAAEGEEYQEAPFDGKWRYLLHDLDFSFGIYGLASTSNTIANYVGRNGEIKDASPLFSQLMRREDCREIFIKKTLDLINGSFSNKNLSTVLDVMNEERRNELEHTYGKNLLEEWVAPTDLKRRLREIKNYNISRGKYILTSYKDYFGLGEVYTLAVKSTEGCKIKVNSYTIDSDFEGSYYMDYDTEVSPMIGDGMEFDYWIINGVKVEKEALLITASMVNDNLVELELVLK